MRVFLTGVAGFIGSHVAASLLERGHAVTGVDSLNAYYDPALKQARLARLAGRESFRFVQADIADAAALAGAAAGASYDAIVHLAAQAGVRYALDHPGAYTQSNLVGPFQHARTGPAHDGPLPHDLRVVELGLRQ
jgi:UDP-glucuronate 4-epimerase